MNSALSSTWTSISDFVMNIGDLNKIYWQSMKTSNMLIVQYFLKSGHIIDITHFHVKPGYYGARHTQRHGISLNLDLSLILMASMKTCLLDVMMRSGSLTGRHTWTSNRGKLCNSTMPAMSQTGVLLDMQLSVMSWSDDPDEDVWLKALSDAVYHLNFQLWDCSEPI